MRVWKMDDCDFVAAETVEVATVWYNNHVGPSVDGDDREVDEYALSTSMRASASPDAEARTFAEIIEKMTVAGESFPAIIAMDAHYA